MRNFCVSAVLICAAFTVSACSSAAQRFAKIGNEYCETGAKNVLTTVKREVNKELREGGAKWEVSGITCDPE